MHRIMLPSHVHANALTFDPIVFHESPDGQLRFPGRADAPVPEGFERKEVRTFREYEAFRRKVNHVENNKIEQANDAEHAYLHFIESVNRPDLRMAMQSMPPQWRAFARLAIERGNARPRTHDAGFYVDAMEYDASNRERWQPDRHERARARK